jgi:hypothetical protein
MANVPQPEVQTMEEGDSNEEESFVAKPELFIIKKRFNRQSQSFPIPPNPSTSTGFTFPPSHLLLPSPLPPLSSHIPFLSLTLTQLPYNN